MSLRIRFLLLSVIVFLVEVLIATRFAHTGFVRGSLGDVLVVVLLFSLVQSVRLCDRWLLALAVFVFACFIEFCQYLHLADWLGFQRGSVLRILLGDTFQWSDLGCYFAGSLLAVGLDAVVTRSYPRHSPRPSPSP